MRSFLQLLAATFLIFASGHSVLAEQKATIFAAASLRDALEDILADYPHDIVVSYGGSGAIARQAAQGAPADIVMLANSAWMDWLEEQGVTRPQDRWEFLGNRLVVIGPAGAEPLAALDSTELLSRLTGGRLALGQTSSVPAGIYARQWLEGAGLWKSVSQRLAETENVRAALALVSRGETPLGVVYATDALAEPQVDVLYQVPPESHAPIRYPLTIVKDRNTKQVQRLAEFISSDLNKKNFMRHGFEIVEGES